MHAAAHRPARGTVRIVANEVAGNASFVTARATVLRQPPVLPTTWQLRVVSNETIVDAVLMAPEP